MAREAGIEGSVMVKVLIDEKGKVVAASILQSNVTDSMNQAALVAAHRCTFEPAKQRHKPVPVTIAIPFEFRLDKH
jgi:protein TonB